MAEEISTVNGEGNWKIRYKVDRDHLVPLVGPIAEILKRRCQEVGGKGALFWPDVDRTQEYPQELRKATAELKKLTGLQDFRPNDCRRTMRSHIESLGVRREVGEALLNHAKGEIEGTYAFYDYWKACRPPLSFGRSPERSERRRAQQLPQLLITARSPPGSLQLRRGAGGTEILQDHAAPTARPSSAIPFSWGETVTGWSLDGPSLTTSVACR